MNSKNSSEEHHNHLRLTWHRQGRNFGLGYPVGRQQGMWQHSRDIPFSFRHRLSS